MAKAGRKPIFRKKKTIGLGIESRKFETWARAIYPEKPPERLRRHIDADLGLCERPGEGAGR
jgi:hypothetical protein